MRFTKFAVLVSVLFAATVAEAGPCPFLVIVLDRSGSMGDTPANGSPSPGNPSKWDIGKSAIATFLMNYGQRLPIGFLTFQEGGLSCTDFSMEAMISPAHDTSMKIQQQLAALSPGGGTNTGEAIDEAIKMINGSQMSMPGHPPGGYIMLITDGQPNCNPGDSSTPSFTVGEITKAKMAGIKTFAVGFGQLAGSDASNLDLMAAAGGEPCSGTACNGHKYYVGDSAASLNMAIDSISQTIAGEFGGACDDSCYANGCPSAGQICVNGACKTDPCATLVNTCAPGDYCYTDGNSAGTCAHACTKACPTGQVCTTQGSCVTDVCANVSCQAGSVCRNGSCVTDTCGGGTSSKPCLSGQLCYEGQCVDDPCRYVTCPSGTACESGTGACSANAGGGAGTPNTGNRGRGQAGCDFAPSGTSPVGLLALALCVLALGLARRRRS